MSLLQNPCSVCGLAILSGDSFIGTGDGQMTNGGSFAHDVCYYRDQANHLQKLCEEQKGEIASLKEKEEAYYNEVFDENGERRASKLESQLATQTEMIGRLTEALGQLAIGADCYRRWVAEGQKQGLADFKASLDRDIRFAEQVLTQKESK